MSEKTNNAPLPDEDEFDRELEDIIRSRSLEFREFFSNRLKNDGLKNVPLKFANEAAAKQFTEIMLEVAEYGFKSGFESAALELIGSSDDGQDVATAEPISGSRH